MMQFMKKRLPLFIERLIGTNFDAILFCVEQAVQRLPILIEAYSFARNRNPVRKNPRLAREFTVEQ